MGPGTERQARLRLGDEEACEVRTRQRGQERRPTRLHGSWDRHRVGGQEGAASLPWDGHCPLPPIPEVQLAQRCASDQTSKWGTHVGECRGMGFWSLEVLRDVGALEQRRRCMSAGKRQVPRQGDPR